MRHSRSVSIALATALVVALVAIGASVADAAPGWVTTQLTSGALYHGGARVSGDRVVWCASSDEMNWQVFTQQIGTDASPVQLTSGTIDNENPQVSGDRVVWSGSDGTFTQKIGTDASPVQLTSGTIDHENLQVSGDRVVWSGSDGIFTQKIGTDASPVQLTTGPGIGSLQVSGDRVVWASCDVTYVYQIFTQKIGTDASPVQLTTGSNGKGSLQVSGDRVVWEAYLGYYNLGIFTQKIGTDASPVQLTSGTNYSGSPQVSGDRVVWSRSDGIFTQKIGTDASPVQLTTGSNGPRSLQVSGDRVVWTDWDGTNYQIFTQKIGTHASPVQLTTGQQEGYDVQVSGDRVVWQDHDSSGNLQIFTAAPSRVPPADPVPAVPGNSTTKRPILVLVAGLSSNTGIFDTNNNGRGAPWDYLGNDNNDALEQKLGVDKIMVVDTCSGVKELAGSQYSGAWGDVIDSTGSLNHNMDALIRWLREHDRAGDFDGHKIILVGHSYGGVIARSMLACGSGRGFGPKDSLREKIIGVVQFGSPNGGSPLADMAHSAGSIPGLSWLNVFFPLNSDVMYQLSPSVMMKWNAEHHGPVGVPIVRLGGIYLPYELSVISNPLDVTNWQLNVLNSAWDHRNCDGLVGWDSLLSGDGSLMGGKQDFGNGFYKSVLGLAHENSVIPGSPQQIVPQGTSDAFFNSLVRAVQGMEATAGTLQASSVAVGAGAHIASVQSVSSSTSAAQGCTQLPVHAVAVTSGSTAHVEVAIDATASVSVCSSDGTPTVAVHSPGGAVLPCPEVSVDTPDGVATLLEVAPTAPGSHTFDIALPAGVSGSVKLSGFISGGAQFALTAGDSPYAGSQATLTASFTSPSGVPLTGAVVTGAAHLDGQPDVPLTFRDDGTGGDATAADGIYTATFTPPVSGRWAADVLGVHATAERAGTIVFDVGDALATVTGSLSETTTPGPGSTFASFGVAVPLHVSADGTYTVSSDLSDGSGAQVGMVTAEAYLASGESTTLVAAIDASELSGISTGNFTLAPLRITRDTDSIDLDAGSAPGLTTSRGYSCTDFYAFSVSLDGPTQSPSPTHAVHFTGTALDTSSTVASVEYSLDGSATWHPVTAADGAFDSHSEGFTIDLNLPDYVYGLLVRETGADGTQLPVADWAGKRFTVDTVAPAQVADFAATVTTETGLPVAHASWLPSEPPSDTVSPVRYALTLDGTAAGETYDTNLDVALPDQRAHTLSITPVDGAGNTGPVSTYAIPAMAVPTHTITTSVPLGHGSILPSATVVVDEGSSVTFTVRPDAGYHIANVDKDGVSVGASSTVTFTDVRANHSIAAGFAVNTAPPALAITSAGFSNPVAYQITSLLTTKPSFKANAAGVTAKLVVHIPGYKTMPAADWTVFNSNVANTAGLAYALPAWNGKNPATGKAAPYAANYGWTLTITKSGQAATKTGSLLLSTIYFQAKGTSAGGHGVLAGCYLKGSAAKPGSVNFYISAKSTAASDQLALRLTGPGGYAAVPSSMPWKLPVPSPAPKTPNVSGPSGIKANGIYNIYITGKTNVTYAVSVIE